MVSNRVHTLLDGTTRPYTAEEDKALDDVKDKIRIEDKTDEIRQLRDSRLQETDNLALADRTMSDAVKTWRQTLRDIPQDYTTESEYDTLLEKQGEFPNITLKHSIWTKP